ncbi:MAG: hypothetical protein FJ197_11345 [Gammaproteobacteria bacterium]|nr:hypothetical protein [Gammaproteobacteria bacterium]
MDSNRKTPARPPIRVSRTAKGQRPQNFQDPALDKLLGIAVSLAGEVSVLRDRVDTLERLIEKSGLFTRKEIESFEPGADARTERAADRIAYIERVLLAAHRELDEIDSGRVARPLDEIIADYANRKI